MPRAPENGIIENIQNISTVGSAQIVFRCNPGFVPAGRMSTTCMSPDGVSGVGTWTPDPVHLVCNGEIQRAQMLQPISSNKVVVEGMQDYQSSSPYKCIFY